MAVLRAARADAWEFARSRYEATLGAATQEFARNVGETERQGAAFARRRFDATVGATTLPARRAMNGFDEVWRRYSRSWGQQGIRGRVQMDITRAQTSLRLLERQLRATTDPERRIRIEAEIERTRQRLEGLGDLADSLGLQRPTMTVGLRGHASTAAQMLGLQGLADRLDGYNVRLHVDIDRSVSSALPNLLGALELQVMRYRTVLMGLAAIHAPVFYSMLAGIPGVAALAGVGVGGLATSVGKGLVGAIGAAGTAAGLGGAAILGYGAAMRSAQNYAFRLNDIISEQYGDINSAEDAMLNATEQLKKYEKGTREHMLASRGLAIATQNHKQEQEELNAVLQAATPRVQRMSKAGHGLTLEMIGLRGAIANEVAPTMERWILGATRLIPTLKPHVLGMVSDMTIVADSYVQVAKKGQHLKSLTTIMRGIESAGVPALRIVGNTALFAVNMIAPMVPAGLEVLDVLDSLTTQARAWSASAEGQSRIGEVWADLWSRGKRLIGVGLDLGEALWGVVRALDQSGVGDYLFRRIEQGAASFEKLMRRGGDARRAIIAFGRDSRPVWDALISLGGEGVKQVLRLVGAISDTNKEGQKFGTLVDVIESVEKSLKPLTDFLIHEFEEIGPLIPPLIKNLAEWFSVMAEATPEMKFFIRFLTNALELFNSLDDDTQRAIARTIAYGAALNALGAGALIKIVGQWILLRRLFNRFPKVPPVAPAGPVAGGPMRPAPRPKPGGVKPWVIPTVLGPPKGGVPKPRGGFPPTVVPTTMGTPKGKVPPPRGGFPPLVVPTSYGKPKGKVPAPAGGFPPMVIPVVPNTSSKAPGGGFASRLGNFLKRVPVLGPAIGLGGRIMGGIGQAIGRTRLGGWFMQAFRKVGWSSIAKWSGLRLIGSLGAFLMGPAGIALMVADLFTGGAITRGFTQAVGDFTGGFMKAWKGGAGKSLPRRLADSILTGIASSFRFGKIVNGFTSGWMEAWKGGSGKSLPRRIADSLFTGLAGALKNLPLVGPFIQWMDKALGRLLGWLGIKSPSKRFMNQVGKPIAQGIIAGIKEIPLVGPLIAKLQDLYKGARKAFQRGGWRGLGSWAIRQIVSGIKQVPVLGPLVQKAEDLYRGGKRAFERGGWRGLGSYVVRQVVGGLKQVPVVGPIVKKAEDLWRGGSRAFKQKGWKGLGSYLVGQIVSGLKKVPVVGPIISKAQQLWSGGSRAFKQKGWWGLGGYVVDKILDGLKNVPVIGPIISKAEDLYGAAKKAFENNGWWGIGEAVIDGIGRGIKDNFPILSRAIGLVGKLLPDWAKKALGIKSPSRPFREIGRNISDSAALGIRERTHRTREAAVAMAREAADAASRAYAPRLGSPDLSGAGPALSPAARSHRGAGRPHRGGLPGAGGTGASDLAAVLARLDDNSERRHQEMLAKQDEVVAATDEVGPSVKGSNDWNQRNDRETRRSNLAGMSREARRYGWVRGAIR